MPVDFKRDVKIMLDEVLHLGGRALAFDDNTMLLSSIPELDSMAVIAIIAAIEERFRCVIEDDEIDGEVFATVGSLTQFVGLKTGLLVARQ
jgi:acyl carrier protein